MSEVTIVITSCGRPDLLEKTIHSFLQYNPNVPIAEWIVSEDSGIPDINKKIVEKYPHFTWIHAKERRGQIKSIDEAYSHVKTPYVFHLEEDWETYRGGVIEESLEILKSTPKASAVMCREHGQGGYKLSANPPFLDCWGHWGYYSFNPGLRRMSDIQELFGGSFSSFTSFDVKNPVQSEVAINNKFRDAGFKMAMTSDPRGYLKHIGENRHVGEKVNTKAQYTLGLCMIVKNESHIIEETLSTIAPLIDCYAITDTGSTDGTPELIESFFAKKGIPGQVFHDTWEDFGTNRTRAIQNCNGRMDYILVIDADDLMVYPEKKAKDALQQMMRMDLNGILLKIRQGSLEYDRMQIFKADDDWRYVGVLHEYPTNKKEGNRIARAPGEFHMISRRLGSRSKVTDKYARDAEILEKALEKEPDNERYVFYLAQSYRDSGNNSKAIEYYTKRYEMGRWVEEAFFSAYQVARLTNDKEWTWKAHEKDPKRIESLCHYLAWTRMNNKFSQETFAMAKHAASIPLPTDKSLFVETDAYTWRALDELSVHAFHTGHKEDACIASDKLLREEKFPPEQLGRILLNRRFCIDTKETPSDIGQRIRVWKQVLKSIPALPKQKMAWANPSECTFSLTIVEPRCHDDLEPILRQVAHIYGGTKTALYIFHGTMNKKFVRDATKGWTGVQYVNLGVQNLTWQKYSEMMTTADFWDKIKTKHTLVFQTDTLLLREVPSEFFGYEFVGAPIHSQHNDLRFQNGGFSLRNVKAMRDAAAKDGPENPDQQNGNGEDIFFGCRVKMPDTLKASEFSVEILFRKNPVGVHKPWMYNSVENLLCLFEPILKG